MTMFILSQDQCFKKPFKNSKRLQSGRGVNWILINILRFRLIKRIIFKRKLSKTDLSFRFCKIGLKILDFILNSLVHYVLRF